MYPSSYAGESILQSDRLPILYLGRVSSLASLFPMIPIPKELDSGGSARSVAFKERMNEES